MAVFCDKSGRDCIIDDNNLRELVLATMAKTEKTPRKMLLLPPDHTRLNSRAGRITEIIYEEFGENCQIDIMPTLGTHAPMTATDLNLMFGKKIPHHLFRVHDWRNDVVTLGIASSEFLRELSGGKVTYEVALQINKIIFGDYDLILSIGQVVPHEVVGMANYTKNLMVGIGGVDIINKSHFLGAACNMEKIMGRAETPVRRLFNYGVEKYLAHLPIVYLLTVMEKDRGAMAMRGFFSGNSEEVFSRAANLSAQVNLQLLDKPLRKVVVYLDPEEFKSTWLGNKAIYRTRMAIADGGELIILAPGLKEFGEDQEIDRLIRKYGYRGTAKTLAAVAENQELRDNLGAAAHLIHGANEGRFTTTYCGGENITAAEIASVGFKVGDLSQMLKKYDVNKLSDGYHQIDGEEIFYISNPALGLWALRENFVNG